MNGPEDIQRLALAAATGDPTAFEGLVEVSQSLAWSLAIRLLGDEDEAADVVQEAFIRVWRHRSRFRPGTRFTTWFYRIVTNLAYDHLRARSRRSRLFARLPREETERVSVEPVPDERGAVRLAGELEGLIEVLPPAQRLAFVLRDLHELSVREVTEVTGMPAHSVKTNLFHARRRLRQELEARSGR